MGSKCGEEPPLNSARTPQQPVQEPLHAVLLKRITFVHLELLFIQFLVREGGEFLPTVPPSFHGRLAAHVSVLSHNINEQLAEGLAPIRPTHHVQTPEPKRIILAESRVTIAPRHRAELSKSLSHCRDEACLASQVGDNASEGWRMQLVRPVHAPKLLHSFVRGPGQLQAQHASWSWRFTWSALSAIAVQRDARRGCLRDNCD
mmetsp:Transcript_58520/g.155759  ORF Transcript_58520/g.155759 Transcript_58520/m.155759 type:complete len:203 (+) Transcript_58520:1385-1993(+)